MSSLQVASAPALRGGGASSKSSASAAPTGSGAALSAEQRTAAELSTSKQQHAAEQRRQLVQRARQVCAIPSRQLCLKVSAQQQQQPQRWLLSQAPAAPPTKHQCHPALWPLLPWPWGFCPEPQLCVQVVAEVEQAGPSEVAASLPQSPSRPPLRSPARAAGQRPAAAAATAASAAANQALAGIAAVVAETPSDADSEEVAHVAAAGYANWEEGRSCSAGFKHAGV